MQATHIFHSISIIPNSFLYISFIIQIKCLGICTIPVYILVQNFIYLELFCISLYPHFLL